MSSSKLRCLLNPYSGCAALTAAAVLIHGYHLGTDDAAIWTPAIKKAYDPGLYSFGAQFFESYSHLSLFPEALGVSAEVAHISCDLGIFLCHILGIFLLLLACWKLLSACFEANRARWCGVALVACTLSVPVAGTALTIMDPYVTSRTLSTPLALLAIASYTSGRRLAAIGWILACVAIHLQMAAFALALLGVLELSRLRGVVPQPVPVFGLLLLIRLPWDLSRAHGPALAALESRPYFSIYNWAWYEWLGLFGPMALLWIIAAYSDGALRRLLRGLVVYAGLFTAVALLLDASPLLQNYTRIQPMRSLHPLYIVLFAVLGALLGEYVLRAKPVRWAALFVPLAIGMWLVARAPYPASAHIEWPGAVPQSDWQRAFLWIRNRTPKNAVFAIDPDYLKAAGVDLHGFRAVAERSVLADRLKDSGAVSLFPALAGEWAREVSDQQGLNGFHLRDFQRLARKRSVGWVVLKRTTRSDLSCPYSNAAVAVCRLPLR